MNFHPTNDPHPCAFDPQVLPHYVLQEQLAKETGKGAPCHLVEANREDWEKVEPLYNKSQVQGYEIAKIEVIVNKTFSTGFNAMLETFEQRSGQSAFTPTWGSENDL